MPNRTYERQPLSGTFDYSSWRTVAINPAAIVGAVNINLDIAR